MPPLEVVVAYDPQTGNVAECIVPPFGKAFYLAESGSSDDVSPTLHTSSRDVKRIVISDKHVLPVLAVLLAKPLWKTTCYVTQKTVSGEVWVAVHKQLEKHGGRVAKGVDKLLTNPIGACEDISRFTIGTVGKILNLGFKLLIAAPGPKHAVAVDHIPARAPAGSTAAAAQMLAAARPKITGGAADSNLPPSLRGLPQGQLEALQAMGFVRPPSGTAGAPAPTMASTNKAEPVAPAMKAPAGGLSGLPPRGGAKAATPGTGAAAAATSAAEAIQRAMMGAMPGLGQAAGQDEDDDELYDEDEDGEYYDEEEEEEQ